METLGPGIQAIRLIWMRGESVVSCRRAGKCWKPWPGRHESVGIFTNIGLTHLVSILKEINPACSLEGLMLKMNVKSHLMWRADPLDKTLVQGKIEGRRRRRWQRMRWSEWHHRLHGHEFEQTQGDSEGQGSLAFCSPWGSRVEHGIVMEQQQQCQSGQDGEASSDSQTVQQIGWLWPGNPTREE